MELGAFIEFVKPEKHKNNLIFELGFNAQPTGGNDDAWVTFAPIFYLTLGVEFN